MKVLVYKDREKYRYITLEDVIDEIFKSIRTFNEKTSIRKLYGLRGLYEKEHPPMSERVIDKSYKTTEVNALPKDFENKVSTGNNQINLHYELYARGQYIAYTIISIIKDVISKENPIMPLNFLENSCCSGDIHGYKYTLFIDEHDSEYKIFLKESWDIIGYYSLFINSGSITKIYINPLRKIYVHNLPIDEIFTEEFMRKKFETYCYTGNTRGQLHYFVGIGDDERCVKCGKYLEKIRETTFSKKEYEDLLYDIMELNYQVPKFKEIVSGVNKDKLKEENMSDEINNFVEKLAKVLGKHNDSIFKNKYKNLLNQLGDYKNVYPEDEEETNYELVKLINNREENRIHLLKIYINQYFRKYISMIAHKFNIEDINVKIPTMKGSDSKELQKFIYDENYKMVQFFIENNVELFKQLKFEYSNQDVNNISGLSDRYNCEWDTIVETSKFNLKNSTDVLLYILITELSKFLITTDQANTIGNFIVAIFDLIMGDDDIYDMSQKEIDKYKTTIYYQEYCKYKRELASEGTTAETAFLKDQFNMVVDGEVDIKDLMDSQGQLEENNFKMEMLDGEVENMAKSKIGEDATPEQIEAFKETYYKNQQQEAYIYTAEFNMLQPKEVVEILEVGDDYGEMPQGTENEGDGISVYSMSEFYPDDR